MGAYLEGISHLPSQISLGHTFCSSEGIFFLFNQVPGTVLAGRGALYSKGKQRRNNAPWILGNFSTLYDVISDWLGQITKKSFLAEQQNCVREAVNGGSNRSD